MKGFSPVCTMICLFISLWFFINLLQIGHPNCPAPILTGSICKISRQKKLKRKMLYSLSIFRNSMNFSNMWLTIARCGKSSWAVVTWKWFLPSMYPNMLFHITLIFHNLNAKRTLVLSCSKSNWFNLQNKQTRIFFEKVNPLFSQIVSIFLKFMMLSNMCITIASLCKSFRTIWTFERFFPCMC